MTIEAKLELPIPRTRSNNGYPIRRKHSVSAELKEVISYLAYQGASFLSIKGNQITVRMNSELMVINVPERE